MPQIALLGASGYTGRLVAAELGRRGHRFVAVGRSRTRLEDALAGVDGVDHFREVDVTDAAAVRRLAADVALLLTTVGPFQGRGESVLAAAVTAGTHYLDTSAEQHYLRWAHDRWHDAAAAAGVTVVPGAGLQPLVGDLLTAVAAATVVPPEAVHVAYLVPGTIRFLVSASPGTRRTLAAGLGQTGVARVDGRDVTELPGEARRLAWFPRPVGPHHAAGYPGGEPITVPRHVPEARTVRSYVAMPSWLAELAQLGAGATRLAPVRRAAATLIERVGRPAGASRRAATRWGCVAEVAGSGAAPAGSLARAWASGHDVYATSASAMVAMAEAVLAGEAGPGVLAPAQVAAPHDMLDRLAARSDLRWSVTRPGTSAMPAS